MLLYFKFAITKAEKLVTTYHCLHHDADKPEWYWKSIQIWRKNSSVTWHDSKFMSCAQNLIKK